MYLGLDIGSSYCKAAVVSDSGKLIRAERTSIPRELFLPGSKIKTFVRHHVENLLQAVMQGLGPPKAFAISSVAPALVAFYDDAEDAQLIFSHLTPTTVQMSGGSDLFSRLSFRRKRTEERIASSGLGPARFMLPLGSAVALIAGCSRTLLDPVSAYELGFRSTEELRVFCRVPHGNHASSPSQISQCGQVTAVTTDTCASMIGAGLRRPLQGMMYYGSYFSAAELKIELNDLLFSAELPSVPYVWHVSLPMYGAFLERFLLEVSGCGSVDQAFARFTEALEYVARNGKESSPIKVSIETTKTVTSESPLAVALHGLNIDTKFCDLAFALARPLADAVAAKRRAGDLVAVQGWYAGGGGARNKALLSLTSGIAGLDQSVRTDSWTARGTAMLAAWCRNRDAGIVDDEETEIISPG